MPATTVPDRAHVVIVGGGAVGTSVAYHLTKMGLSDVVLLEQGRLSCGTTWHAAGLVGQLRASQSLTRLVQYSTQLYAELEAETGLSAGYKQCGGVTVARTEDRMTQLRRTAASAVAFDLPCELLTPEQALEHYPVMRVDDLVGAIWLPADGKANPTDLTMALAKGARMRGARIVEQVRVTGMRVLGGRVTGVRTDAGDIEAEIVVNCAGQWAKQVGAMAGVNVPLHSAEHFYVVSEVIDGVHPDLPILRDPDGYTYFKEEVGGLVVGGFEPEAKPWVAPDSLPYPFEFQLLDEDWEHFEILMNSALLRIPALEVTGIKKFYNGPESFTPDNQFVLGEAPECQNFFVGAGFNSVGIATAGGAGRALAEWIVTGAPQGNLTGVDIRRFARFNGNNRWLHDRVAEVLGIHYEIPWPNRELDSARPFRRSPVHHLLADAGANFGSRMGWERANFFAPVGADPVIGYTWGKPNWLGWSGAEQTATRTGVAVFDQTSFSKYVLVGPGAQAGLQWLCTADVGVQVGRVVYTGMLNERGTYESDVTITRTGDDEYFIVSSAATTERDKDHIRQNLPPDAQATLFDVTSAWAVFGVMGPTSRDLLATLTDADLGEAAFPFGSSREISLGYATVRATRITYVGELGWEIYVPTEFAVGVYEQLLAAGQRLGVARGGYYAIEALRLEKGYRAFGRELTPAENPVEAGLLFACKLDTDIDFLGRDALERARAEGVQNKLVGFRVDSADAMLWGGELILRDGLPAGQVTSAAWAETTSASVGLGYVRAADGATIDAAWVRAGSYQVDVGGVLYPITVSLKAIYDPANVRVRDR